LETGLRRRFLQGEKGNWYHKLYEGREFFTDREEEDIYRKKQRSLTRGEGEGLCCLLNLEAGAVMLDVFCGNGRHALDLAQRGFKVAGVDTSFSRISFANRWAREEDANAYFLVGDAKYLPLRPRFDALLILGGSFSHHLEEEENISLLLGFRNTLRAGGKILIDNPNPLRFWRIQHPGGSLEEQERLAFFDLPLGQGETFGHVRYYGVETIKRLFQKSDLEVRGVFGDRKGSPYSLESPRMIVIGRRMP
jgi:SAM-dependent methyltransferase